MNEEPTAQEDAVAKAIVDCAYQIHTNLGPGLLESVYEECLAHELKKRELVVERQVSLPILYDGLKLDAALRLDLLVDKSVIVEIKAVDALLPIHHAQLLTYLKLSKHRLGLLINFNVPIIKQGIKRIVSSSGCKGAELKENLASLRLGGKS